MSKFISDENRKVVEIENEHGIIYRVDSNPYVYNAWPTICKDENGKLYVACSGHRIGHFCPYGKNYLFTSNDEGKKWSAPMIINDGYLDDRDAGLTYLGDGKIMLAWFVRPKKYYTEEINWIFRNSAPITHGMALGTVRDWEVLPKEYDKSGSFIKVSDDYGFSWNSEPILVPVSSPHGPIKLKNGKLLYLGKEFKPENHLGGDIMAYESSDEGKTWDYLSTIEYPIGEDGKLLNEDNLHEPFAIELDDGTIVGIIRAQGENVYHRFTMYAIYSYDGGKTWTHPEAMGISGSPPHLLKHSSGALVLTYGRREVPFGIRAMISYDGGYSYGDEIILQNSHSGDIGYPSSVELSDGSIITVYYERVGNDDGCSLTYTKWNIPKK